MQHHEGCIARTLLLVTLLGLLLAVCYNPDLWETVDVPIAGLSGALVNYYFSKDNN